MWKGKGWSGKAWRWLKDFIAAEGNLLGSDILCEVTIHILSDFTRRVYVSKIQAPPAVLAKIVESVVRTGVDIGAQHGITVQYKAARPPKGGTHPPRPPQPKGRPARRQARAVPRPRGVAEAPPADALDRG